MNWIIALVAATALLAVATGAGLWFRSRQGHVAETATAGADASGRDALDLGLDPRTLGEVTLVQFSTEYCSRCPGTARSLGALADRYEGVRHVEIDLTHAAKLADRFSVLQTPTTLVLDRSGTSIARIGGVPRQAELTALLDRLTGSDHVLI